MLSAKLPPAMRSMLVKVMVPEALVMLPALQSTTRALGAASLNSIESRPSPGYARRGGFYGVTLHDFADRGDEFGFRMVEYEAIHHVPILRDAWVLSFRGRVQTSDAKDGQQTPFFMLPALGGGSSLRGFDSWRFRDQHSLLLQAEWRVMVNRYLDLAFFYDAGKVAPRAGDLDLSGLQDDIGAGVRFHGPLSTPLRVELAKSREGLSLVFASSPSF
jgi:outer membrane protein assembly factor BamA